MAAVTDLLCNTLCNSGTHDDSTGICLPRGITNSSTTCSQKGKQREVSPGGLSASPRTLELSHLLHQRVWLWAQGLPRVRRPSCTWYRGGTSGRENGESLPCCSFRSWPSIPVHASDLCLSLPQVHTDMGTGWQGSPAPDRGDACGPQQ